MIRQEVAALFENQKNLVRKAGRFSKKCSVRPVFFGLLVILAFSATPRANGQVPRSQWLGTPAERGAALMGSISKPQDLVGSIAVPNYCDSRQMRADATIRALAAPDSNHIVAVGDHGLILHSNNAGQSWTIRESGVACRLDDVIQTDANVLISVGGYYDSISRISRGVVLKSRDGGLTWQRVDDDELPRIRRVVYRGQKLIARGDWSASTRGNFFESRDEGRSWDGAPAHAVDGLIPERPSATAKQMVAWADAVGQPVAVRAIVRAGTETAFAAGDHGVMLKSSDRGKSWSVIRGQNRRPAILVVAKDAASIPWTLIGRETIEHRRRVAVIIAESNDQNGTESPYHLSSPSGHERDWVWQSLQSINASGMDVMSVAKDETIQNVAVGHFHDWLSIHRPSVLLLNETLPETIRNGFLSAAVSQGTQRVVEYGSGRSGKSFLLSSALLPKSGVLAGDFDQDAGMLVNPSRRWESARSVYVRYDSAGHPSRLDSLAMGLHLDVEQTLFTPREPVSRRRMQVVQGRLQHSAKLHQLISQRPSEDTFKRAFQSAIRQTAPEDRLRFAWSVVSQLNSSRGEPKVQNASIEVFCDEIDHPSVCAFLKTHWLARASSAEYRRLPQSVVPLYSGSGNDSEPTHIGSSVSLTGGIDNTNQFHLPQRNGVEVAAVSPFQDDQSTIVQASSTSPTMFPGRQATFPGKRSRTGNGPLDRGKPVDIDLLLEMHPLTLLARQAHRQDDEQNQKTDSANLKHVIRSASNWSVLLRSFGEQSLTAVKVSKAPRLDGRFDESMWREWRAFSDEGKIACAYDDRFVYFAIECSHNMLANDLSRRKSEFRDCRLDDSDRVLLRLDTDRDLVTSMRLECTLSGKTRDGVDGNLDWQPTWFLKPTTDGTTARIEIAITQADLVDEVIESGSKWFLSTEALKSNQKSTWELIPNPENWLHVVFE